MILPSYRHIESASICFHQLTGVKPGTAGSLKAGFRFSNDVNLSLKTFLSIKGARPVEGRKFQADGV
jgi:hypothetical protein